MEVRKVLQTEVWSKTTSRKIWSVFRKILSGIEVFIVVLVIWFGINRIWLTSSERRAAIAALEKIDALQRFAVMSREQYSQEHAQAKSSVDAVERAAWTSRDLSIASTLSTYLLFTDMQRQDQELKMKLSDSQNERIRKLNLQVCPDSSAGSQFQSAVLHEALR